MAKTYSMKFGSGDPRTLTGLSPTFLIFQNIAAGSAVTPPSISESPASSGIYIFTWGTTTPIAFLADAATTSPGSVGRYVTGQLDPADRADEYGNTLTALGTTMVSLGTTSVALGTSGVALGTSIYAGEVAMSSTLLAIGNTSIALGITGVAIGTSVYAGQNNLGSTLVGIGNTSIAQGTTEIALGNTILALVGIGITLDAAIGSTASSFGTISSDPVDLFGYVKRISELLQGQQAYIKGSGVLTMLDRTGGTTLVQRTVSNSASMVLKS